MKLQALEVFIVGNPPPAWGGRYFIFVKLQTSTGLVGYGEVYGVPFHPRVVERMLGDVFERYFLDQDPFQLELLWRRVYASGYTQRPDASVLGVLSGLEIACWDILGKALEQPIHRLLGGAVRSRLRTYSYLYPEPSDAHNVYTHAETAAKRALAYQRRGFTAVKFDPIGPYGCCDPRHPPFGVLQQASQMVRTLREAVGPDLDLLIGTHGQLTPAAAIQFAHLIEPSYPLWFEEPTPPELPEEMARVAQATSIPVATGERLATKYEFARVLRCGAASILQMALGRVGGLLEAKKIAALAEVSYAQIAPHLYCGPIEGVANMHLAACTPNFLILESIQDWSGFHARLLASPIVWEAGEVVVPTAPGLGVDLNETVARAHPYHGTELHLEMEPDPL